MTDTTTRLTWRIEDPEGNVWLHEEGYTAALAIAICTVLDRDEWTVLDPTSSPFALMGMLTVLFAQRYGCDLTEARELVLMEPLDNILAMLKVG